MSPKDATPACQPAGREYLRVSVDRSGRSVSHQRQHGDNERAADRLGVPIEESYRDTGSASKFATKTRDDFERLLTDLRAGVFKPGDLLFLWESSRGSRRESEWHLFLDLLEDRGVKVYVTMRDRLLDPSEPYDREALSRDGASNALESARLSKRTRSGVAAHAQAGKPSGRIPYGYQRVYDERTREFVSQEPDPAEADVVRTIFDRIEKGHALSEIVFDLNKAGVPTRRRWTTVTRPDGTMEKVLSDPKPWTRSLVRQIAINPLYVGKRLHQPGGKRGGGEVIEYEAAWPPLIKVRQFNAVQVVLLDPKRRTTRGGRARHLVSGIGRCGVCGGPLSATTAVGRSATARALGERLPYYRCPRRSCVRIPQEPVDAFAEFLILRFLSRPEHYSVLLKDSGRDGELERVKTELSEARAEHDALADSGISVALAAKKEPEILGRIKRLENQERALETPNRLRGLIEPGEGVAERWEAATITTRRAIARLLLAPDVMGTLIVRALSDLGVRGNGAVGPQLAPVERLALVDADGNVLADAWMPAAERKAFGVRMALVARANAAEAALLAAEQSEDLTAVEAARRELDAARAERFGKAVALGSDALTSEQRQRVADLLR